MAWLAVLAVLVVAASASSGDAWELPEALEEEMMELMETGHWMLAVFGEELEGAGPGGPASRREEGRV